MRDTKIFNILKYEPSNSSIDTVSATDVSCHAGKKKNHFGESCQALCTRHGDV